jgi:vacuolar-type H+-ATPase subunit E/Vma4
MSLHHILEAIEAEGDAQVYEIEAQTFTQCSEIIADAHLVSEKIKAKVRAKEIAPAYKERARIIQKARLEALQIIGDAREELVDTALGQVHARLARTRTDNAYPIILRKLLQESLTELNNSLSDNDKIKLEADARDRDMLKDILTDLKLDFSVQYTLDCWGGVIAKSKDDCIVVINTLETRLERATPYLRCYLAALFESEGDDIAVNQVSERAFVSA